MVLFSKKGSGASFSAKENPQRKLWVFCFQKNAQAFQLEGVIGKQKTKPRFLVGRRVFLCSGSPPGINAVNPKFIELSDKFPSEFKLMVTYIFMERSSVFICSGSPSGINAVNPNVPEAINFRIRHPYLGSYNYRGNVV